MRYLEIRRHSLTKAEPTRGGSELSTEGVALARRVGATTGPFRAVFASSAPCTLETAIAMGFAVTRALDVLGDVPMELLEQLGHSQRFGGPRPFAVLPARFASEPSLHRLGLQQRKAWLSIAEELPDSSTVLIVSHALSIEAGLSAAIDVTALATQEPFGHCEGVRLSWEDGVFSSNVEILRVAQP